MNIFSKYKDKLLDMIAEPSYSKLEFPLEKIGKLFNGYTRGDFIIVGGRKTSGKSSFMLQNYVISPLIQYNRAKKKGNPFKLKVIYINSRKNIKSTIDRMTVNYYNHIVSKATKISVPALYGYPGSHSIERSFAKKIFSTATTLFDSFITLGVFNIEIGKKTIFEVDDFIRRSMEEYGHLDEDNGDFIYDEKYEDLIPIIVIDDVTGIVGENGGVNIKNENGHLLATRLKYLAKSYNILIVLGVPSMGNSYNRNLSFRSTVDEISPYHLYADRAILLHNPLETEEKTMYGYRTEDYLNAASGIGYLRIATIVSNYMGASGNSIGLFMYPENGLIKELPKPDKEEDLVKFFDYATPKKKETKGAAAKKIKNADLYDDDDPDSLDI